MKKLNASILVLLFIGSAMAQVSLPYGVTPLNGEIRLLYRPGFESTCSTVNGTDVSDIPLTVKTTLTLDSAGRFNYRFAMDDSTATFDVNADGSGMNLDSMQFANGNSDKNDLLANLVKISPPGYGLIGKQLRQGGEIQTIDLCKNIPEGRSSFFSKVSRSVAGTVVMRGRPSLIISTNIDETCTIGSVGKISFIGGGWETFDLKSGLASDSESNMIVKIPNQADLNMKMKSSCVILDNSHATLNNINSGSTGKSTEQRLIELKSLIDKGLINQEQYEQKRTDILKSL